MTDPTLLLLLWYSLGWAACGYIYTFAHQAGEELEAWLALLTILLWPAVITIFWWTFKEPQYLWRKK